jgi:hypothetical protein
MIRSKNFFHFLLGASLLASAAHGQTVLYGNLNATIGSYYYVGLGQGPLYNSFSTGATSLNLTDLKIVIQGISSNATFTAALFSNNVNNTPGLQIQALGTLSDSNDPSTATAVDIPVSPSVKLAANTRYWIGLSTASDSDTQWATTQSTAGTGNISNEYSCVYEQTGNQPTAVTGPKPRGYQLVCSSNATDPFLMQVTASSTTPTVSAPALSFPAMVTLSILLAASAAMLLRRSGPIES